MSNIILIEKPISLKQLQEIADQRFGDIVKGVVDIKKGIIALGADLHADEESFLLERGSVQADLWGINLYPNLTGPDFLEFDSMINIRPSQNNRSRGVENPKIQEEIKIIVNKLIKSS